MSFGSTSIRLAGSGGFEEEQAVSPPRPDTIRHKTKTDVRKEYIMSRSPGVWNRIVIHRPGIIHGWLYPCALPPPKGGRFSAKTVRLGFMQQLMDAQKVAEVIGGLAGKVLADKSLGGIF